MGAPNTEDTTVYRLLTDGTLCPADEPRPDAFLLGPVPMPWLRAADSISRTALMLALQLAHMAGCKGSLSVRVRFTNPDFKARSRWAWRRALRALESAGLVAVKQVGKRL